MYQIRSASMWREMDVKISKTPTGFFTPLCLFQCIHHNPKKNISGTCVKSRTTIPSGDQAHKTSNFDPSIPASNKHLTQGLFRTELKTACSFADTRIISSEIVFY